MYLGVKAVLAKSIERIHAANLVNFGIVPFAFADESDYDALDSGAQIIISGLRRALQSGAEVVTAISGTREFKLKINLSKRQREILLEGGLLPYTVKENR
jgi:aconitate hydratase